MEMLLKEQYEREIEQFFLNLKNNMKIIRSKKIQIELDLLSLYGV